MRDQQDSKFKEQDEQRMKKLKELNLPLAIKKVDEMNEAPMPIKRAKLSLPKA